MRNKIKMFAQKKATLPPGRHKIVILDEADRWASSLKTADFFLPLLSTFVVACLAMKTSHILPSVSDSPSPYTPLPLAVPPIPLLSHLPFRSMTAGAQQALRRTMEIYSNTTRFALACNTSSKVIEPIQSRCAIIRYSRLTEKEILDRLLTVCQAENVCCPFPLHLPEKRKRPLSAECAEGGDGRGPKGCE